MRANKVRPYFLALGVVTVLSATGGCSMLGKAMSGMKEALLGPETEASRLAPAAQDLPGTSTIAVSSLDGRDDDANAVGGRLGEYLTQSGRFQVVERDKLQAIASERGCGALDYTCLAGALPASAVVVGSVSPSTYSEHVAQVSHECKKNKKKAICVTYTRTGSARAAANLRLVDTATGKILYQSQLTKTVDDQSMNIDNPPDALDQAGMVDRAREQLAMAFFEAVSPHYVTEKVELERDRDLPELGNGNEHLKGGRIDDAITAYQQAKVRADGSKDIDAAERAKVHYSLGAAQGIGGRYEEAIANLEQALKLDDDDDFRELLTRVRSWQADAERASKQLAYGQPTAPTSASNTTEVAGTTM